MKHPDRRQPDSVPYATADAEADERALLAVLARLAKVRPSNRPALALALAHEAQRTALKAALGSHTRQRAQSRAITLKALSERLEVAAHHV